jgi:hypothetical protein
MAIVLARQYQRLTEIAESAEHFVWGYNGEPYEGIVRPAGIIRQVNNETGERFLFFVIAEDVPNDDPREPTRLMVARLDDNSYEFKSYDSSSKTLGEISDANLVSDRGTVDQVCQDLREGGGYLVTCNREWPV